jgi:hypothetical protein
MYNFYIQISISTINHNISIQIQDYNKGLNLYYYAAVISCSIGGAIIVLARPRGSLFLLLMLLTLAIFILEVSEAKFDCDFNYLQYKLVVVMLRFKLMKKPIEAPQIHVHDLSLKTLKSS